VTDKHLDQDELDRIIVRELSRLPFHAPSRGFEGRVMAQVRLPAPRFVVTLRRAQAWALEPRRAFALAGAYSVCAAIALGFAVPWLIQHSAPLHSAWDTLAARSVAFARDLGMSVAGLILTSRPYETLRGLPLLREHFVPVLVLLSAAYAAAGVALHHLLKDPRGKRVPVTTAR
jgi:hypothetical protein